MSARVYRLEDVFATVEIPVIEGEVAEPAAVEQTVRIPLAPLLPPVPHTTRVARASLCQRLARRWRIFRRSPLAADLHARRGLVLFPALLLGVALAVVLLTRGSYWTGTEWAAIPTGAAQ